MKLTAKARAKVPRNAFGLPAQKKYPMPDASHAGNAKARAAQEYNEGRLSAGQKDEIDRKADKVLGR